MPRFESTEGPFAALKVSTWADLRNLLLAATGWVFRGQTQDWPLATSLERALIGLKRDFADDYEKRVLDRFRSRLHEFGQHHLSDDRFDVAALLQHCGGPTRLLDFTSSPFVAAFFAFEEPSSDRKPVIWAVNAVAISAIARKSVGIDDPLPVGAMPTFWPSDFSGRFALETSRTALAVAVAEARYISDRMAAQQGVFLVPFSVRHSFQENLLGMLGNHTTNQELLLYQHSAVSVSSDCVVLKLVLNASVRAEALKELRHMNISPASLFPGIDGFARSLKYWLNLDHV